MEAERFIKNFKELCEFTAEHTYKDDQIDLGDWRAIKRDLGNGEIQGIAYRKATEINIMYCDNTDIEIDMFITMEKQYEPLLDIALEKYCKEFEISYPSEANISFTLKFKTLREFEVFVYQYLLPLAP
ncbi:hypothetical protein [Bacillus toyonensis]|uniref:hypothetical protein n=1 Tax=Bacillus toyonensis TaxID=155322 RepID=UPI002E22FF9F|nr:hypothetical protein [Bacillus toyonensis]